tara:strand:- start:77 stop:583 length:507 start_codon:yes stop_codon:yes gene_type:complete
MVGAFEQAWSLLKALPEQQMYEQMSRPMPYGTIPDIQQQRLGTVHPAVINMINRVQNPHEYKFIDDEHDRRLIRNDLFSNVPMRPNLRVLGRAEEGQFADDPAMVEGRTPLSIENYGKYFDEGRAAFVPYDAKLHTGHFNIPLASGDRVENSSPLRPRDASYGLGGMQ